MVLYAVYDDVRTVVAEGSSSSSRRDDNDDVVECGRRMVERSQDCFSACVRACAFLTGSHNLIFSIKYYIFFVGQAGWQADRER